MKLLLAGPKIHQDAEKIQFLSGLKRGCIYKKIKQDRFQTCRTSQESTTASRSCKVELRNHGGKYRSHSCIEGIAAIFQDLAGSPDC